MARMAKPDWAPFRPGTSYFVPPRPAGTALGVLALIDHAGGVVGSSAAPRRGLSADAARAVAAASRGYPCSTYFIEGFMEISALDKLPSLLPTLVLGEKDRTPKKIINHKLYDHKADVFSFAIVLWELATSMVPYDNMTPLQAALGVRQGLHLDIPGSVHPRLTKLIRWCWDEDPNARLTFAEITIELQDSLHHIEAYLSGFDVSVATHGHSPKPTNDGILPCGEWWFYMPLSTRMSLYWLTILVGFIWIKALESAKGTCLAYIERYGPYYWVKCKPDEPIPVSQPNQGSVRGRKEKKQIKQRRDFIMAEKKRRAQYSAAVKRNEAERTEWKMAAVARERAWAARLIELKQLEEEIKVVMA
ncbi:Serine/threonine-protein kinase STY17 [Zea mays]|uniref:Serine/threonine-protein kinase STY17 n=1 Tax=Zea mays TaxID=4577 RepID=A0A3L6FG75_MAIZE|nr:Serine/threonine-protein kinase STY17 [Zea mays]